MEVGGQEGRGGGSEDPKQSKSKIEKVYMGMEETGVDSK